MRPTDDIGEQDLPGIGRRYDLRDADGNDLAVIIHHNGRRDIYAHGRRGDMDLVFSLTDDQARRLGAIIGGAYFKPAAVSEIEAVVGGLAIDWVTLRPDSPAVGHTIAELEIRRRTGATVAAILREGGGSAITPEPDEVLAVGDRLVVMGLPADLSTFTSLIVG